jgi:hypothetical protein
MHISFINLFSGCIENFDAANYRLNWLGKEDTYFVRHRLHSGANSRFGVIDERMGVSLRGGYAAK